MKETSICSVMATFPAWMAAVAYGYMKHTRHLHRFEHISVPSTPLPQHNITGRRDTDPHFAVKFPHVNIAIEPQTDHYFLYVCTYTVNSTLAGKLGCLLKTKLRAAVLTIAGFARGSIDCLMYVCTYICSTAVDHQKSLALPACSFL